MSNFPVRAAALGLAALLVSVLVSVLASNLAINLLEAATRPARPLPRKLLCVEVKDPGTGTTWTCAERRP